MTKKLTTLFILSICFISIWTLNSCKKEKSDDTDIQLYNMAVETSGFTWFKDTNVLLDKSSGSGHSQPFLRTRYNSIAAAKLDSVGKVITGAIFPEGSLIVKELWSSTSALDRYAILYKQSGNSNADAKGWVWGYINSDGNVEVPSSEKGSACNGCHAQSGNIDYMLMNKYFP